MKKETKFIIYNNFLKGTPTKWEISENQDILHKKMLECGDDWDITTLDVFKSWYPDLKVE